MYTATLSESGLFKGLSPAETHAILSAAEHTVRQCSEGDLITLKGTRCNSMIILAEGRLRCENGTNGARIETMTAPTLVSPVFLYCSENKLPVTTVADTHAEIIIIGKAEFTRMLSSDIRVLENFLGIVSDRTRPLSDNLAFFGFKNIKSKFAHLVLEQSTFENSGTIRLKHTQKDMAAMFGVTRPALARAIGEMAAEGAINANGKNITILYPEKLRQYASKRHG